MLKLYSHRYSSCIIWGFILYSIAQVVGAIWCYLGWATLFNWGERHLQSATLWCYFAAYLHLRFLPAWDMRRKAWFSLYGFILVFFFSYSGIFREASMPRIGG
jgi:ABC-type transport system involved in cytochrome c biogenesis permease subunit